MAAATLRFLHLQLSWVLGATEHALAASCKHDKTLEAAEKLGYLWAAPSMGISREMSSVVWKCTSHLRTSFKDIGPFFISDIGPCDDLLKCSFITGTAMSYPRFRKFMRALYMCPPLCMDPALAQRTVCYNGKHWGPSIFGLLEGSPIEAASVGN